jgi:hypothetical protein
VGRDRLKCLRYEGNLGPEIGTKDSRRQTNPM